MMRGMGGGREKGVWGVVRGGKRGGGELIIRSMRASYCVASGVELVCLGGERRLLFLLRRTLMGTRPYEE